MVNTQEKLGADNLSSLEKGKRSAVLVPGRTRFIAAAYGIEWPCRLGLKLGELWLSREARAEYRRMVLERAYSDHVVYEQVRYDEKTGLLKQKGWLQEVRWAMGFSRMGRYRLAITELDLDNFKPVNDVLGHAAGDEVLDAFARILASETREEDTPGNVSSHMAGDEFGALLRFSTPEQEGPGKRRHREMTDDERAVSFIDRIRNKFDAYTRQPLSDTDSRTLQELVPGLGVSGGYALLIPGKSLGAALLEADRNLYEQKQASGDVRNATSAFGLIAPQVAQLE